VHTWDAPMRSPRPRSMPAWLIAVLAVLIAVPIAAFGASPVSAHASLVSASPAQGASLPTQVVLTFDQPPREVTAVRAVSTNDGPLVELGAPVLSDTTVTVPWPRGQAPDLYRLYYAIVSADGDPVDGTIIFTYKATNGPASIAPRESVTSGLLDRAWLVGVVIVGLVALALLIVSRRRRTAQAWIATGRLTPTVETSDV
jgi:methionine-rich copper-binding protein CopC